ncbi:MAG: carbonic anhydrase, partial [Chitinophagaceae bacterium]
VIVSCIDSRTSPEIILDAGLGDLLTIRIAGNITSPEIIGSVEMAVRKIGAKLIVVMGHSNCGAVFAAVKQVKEGTMGSVTSKIDRAILQCCPSHAAIDATDPQLMNRITRHNVKNSIEEILEQSTYLKERVLKGEVGIVGACYYTDSGMVNFEDDGTDSLSRQDDYQPDSQPALA